MVADVACVVCLEYYIFRQLFLRVTELGQLTELVHHMVFNWNYLQMEPDIFLIQLNIFLSVLEFQWEIYLWLYFKIFRIKLDTYLHTIIDISNLN